MVSGFDNSTLRTVIAGTALLGAVSGALGSFAVLRRQSLLGDAVAHASLPGIVIAFLLTQSKAPLVLALGAAVAGWLATLLVQAILRHSRVPFDSALGMVMTVFFGLGLVLLTRLQHQQNAGQAGLERYLFGQAATLLAADIETMLLLGGGAAATLVVLWKEFKLISFDPDFAASLGYPVARIDALLTALLVVAVVVGLQGVGVVLMSALVVAPGVAARQWTDRLGRLVILAAVFGGASGAIGTLLSDWLSAPGRPVPTGPTIVLVATAFVLASLPARRWSEPMAAGGA